MIKLAYLREMEKVKELPQEIKDNISKTLEILDSSYGKNRNSNSFGGYVLILESKEDFSKINETLYTDLEKEAIPEFVDLITCSDGEVYTASLVLSNSDFGITYIMPLKMLPDNLKDYIEI